MIIPLHPLLTSSPNPSKSLLVHVQDPVNLPNAIKHLHVPDKHQVSIARLLTHEERPRLILPQHCRDLLQRRGRTLPRRIATFLALLEVVERHAEARLSRTAEILCGRRVEDPGDFGSEHGCEGHLGFRHEEVETLEVGGVEVQGWAGLQTLELVGDGEGVLQMCAVGQADGGNGEGGYCVGVGVGRDGSVW